MSRPVSPLSMDHWRKTQEVYKRVLSGEDVPLDEIPDGKPEYRCPRCKDTAFEVTKRLDGTTTAKRCGACKGRVDAEIKSQERYRAPEVPEDDPPDAYDWKKASGLDEGD